MTKLIRTDLDTLLSDASLAKLEQLSVAIKAAKTPIDNFVSYSGRRLKGEAYDAIRTALGYYLAAMNKLCVLDDNAHDNVVAADKNLIAFMEDYSMLDDSRLETLGNGLNYIGRRMGEMQWHANNAETEEDRAYYWQCYSYYQGEYNKVLKEYNKLKDLAPKDRETGVVIDYISQDIQSIKSALANLKEPVPTSRGAR